jgi:hypothetical protein
VRECYPDDADAALISIREALEVEETVAYSTAEAREELFGLYIEGMGEEAEVTILEALAD